jgi:dienelactone hydrolase
MRAFEIFLAIILLIRIILPLLHREQWVNWTSAVALGAMTIHVIFEGYRWQMIPLYGITVGLSFFSFWRIRHPKSQSTNLPTKSLALALVGIFILGIAFLIPVLLPVPRTPEPTGVYDVGTTTVTLVDNSREELYSESSGEPRTIIVQIWYPAELEPGAKPAPWLDHMEVMGAVLAAKLNLPTFFLDHVRYSRAHAIADAAISSVKPQYPLLLFSHGWGGFKAQNTYQVEELASYGYIVAAPDHTYGAIATVLPDGLVALNNPEALPLGMGLSEEDFLESAQALGDQWAGDLSHILDSLENLESDDPAGQLANHLDFTRVGVMGHSTGGGAAIQFCANDQRCQAALGMDPYMAPVSYQVQHQGLTQPYLAIFSETWAQDNSPNNIIFSKFFHGSNGDKYQYFIEKTAHYDFTDMSAFSPLAPYLDLKGALDGKQVSKIINTYTLAFFDRHLLGESGSLLDQPSSQFPEMIYLP